MTIIRKLFAKVLPLKSNKSDYDFWMRDFEKKFTPTRKEVRHYENSLNQKPAFSILLPVYNPSLKFLNEAIQSVVKQSYTNWELVIVDDGSNEKVVNCLKKWQKKHPRISVTCHKENQHISKTCQDAFDRSTKDWICVLDHDDCFAKDALYEIAKVIVENPKVKLIYSDEDKLNEKGRRVEPYFKPDWSPDLMLSQNYLNHLTCFYRECVDIVGGWREGFEGAQDYDLYLRIIESISDHQIFHISKVLYHWRQSEASTAVSVKNKTYAHEAAKKTLEDHLVRTGKKAKVLSICEDRHFRIQYGIIGNPRVSIIIPTQDRKEIFEKCINSVLEKTDYLNYEILVIDHHSQEKETLSYLMDLKNNLRIKILKFEGVFNYSKMNNQAVLEASGEILLFLNNDTEVISGGWLTEMVSHVIRPEMGCVGAKLYYPNDKIQHAGVVLGIQGVAGHSHKYFSQEADGYFVRLRLIQNVSAVTAACLAVRKEVFEECDGFDEENLTVAFNDVDFCLKVRAAGYLNLWTPYAELYHHESLSRGSDQLDAVNQKRFQKEIEYMQKKWEKILLKDPYYSPHLSLTAEDFSIRKKTEN